MNRKLRLPLAVILTALPVERREVCTHLLRLAEETHPEGTVYWEGTFPCESCDWSVKVVEIGPGNPRAAFETERAISYFKPNVALFVGVAGGIKDVQIGDVVAARKVYGYEFGKANTIFQPRPEVGNATYRMEQRARAIASSKDWLKRLKGRIPVPEPNVYVEAIAAGEQVINSTRSATYEFLRQQYSDALAVEMEGIGFLSAAHANQHVNAIIIRGISDLVDGKSEADATNSQELASRHASAFAFEILAKLGNDKKYLASATIASSTKKGRKEGLPRNKYSITNNGQMAVGDNAQMTINWYKYKSPEQ